MFPPIAAKSQNFKSAIEVPPLGLYAIDLKTKSVSLNPWVHSDHESLSKDLNDIQTMLKANIRLKSSILPPWMQAVPSLISKEFNLEDLLRDDAGTEFEKIFQKLLAQEEIDICCNELMVALKKSVRDRITATPAICRDCLNAVDRLDRPRRCSHAKIGILFSGGIDCTILTCLVDQMVDAHLPIDLINVSFEKIIRAKTNKPIEIDYNTPDRLSAVAALDELKRLNPHRRWNLIEVNVTRDELNGMLRDRICHLVYPLTSVLDESLGAVLWFGSNADGHLQGKPYRSSCRVSQFVCNTFHNSNNFKNTFVAGSDDWLWSR